MKKMYLTAVALAPLAALAMMAQPAQAKKAGDKIPGSYICVFKKGAVSRNNAKGESERAVQAAGGEIMFVYDAAIQGFAANMSEQAMANLKAKDKKIAYCEQDRVISAGPVRVANVTTTQSTQQTPWGVARVNGGVAGDYARAWVIDSGIDEHPDLNLIKNLSRTYGPHGSPTNDGTGHGTHVAGTIAARDNAFGVVGVAPGAPVISLRVLGNDGTGTVGQATAAINSLIWKSEPGEVANLSFSSAPSQAMDDAVLAVAATGVRFVIAAGNNYGAPASNYSPARVNGPNIYTVSAFAAGDVFASFSNVGNPPIDYSEPGDSILSTFPAGGYAVMHGTSMAAPHLSGLLLLGAVQNGGTVTGDPDGIPDIIGVH